MTPAWIDALNWGESGLLPAIIQDARSGDVLMLAWMNRDALEKTAQTGKTHFWSRSRQKMWMKGESSGHVQVVASIHTDCDDDAIVVRVSQTGGIACHTGRASCFYKRLDQDQWVETAPVLKDPAQIYGE
jgi:phosphoribosyl-AMP cyclohydrolase